MRNQRDEIFWNVVAGGTTTELDSSEFLTTFAASESTNGTKANASTASVRSARRLGTSKAMESQRESPSDPNRSAHILAVDQLARRAMGAKRQQREQVI